MVLSDVEVSKNKQSMKEITDLREFHPKTILLWLFFVERGFYREKVSEAAKQAKREIA